MSSKQTWIWAAITILLEMLLVALFVPRSFMDKITDMEHRWMTNAYSEETVLVIHENTSAVHEMITRDTGLADGLSWMFLPAEGTHSTGTGMARMGENFWFPFIESRGKALDEMTWITIMRVVSLYAWAPLLILLFIPTIVDGVMERRIKQHTFKYPSPFLYRHGLRTSLLVGVLLVVFILSPLPVHPYILPLGLIVVILTTGIVVIGNLPKRL